MHSLGEEIMEVKGGIQILKDAMNEVMAEPPEMKEIIEDLAQGMQELDEISRDSKRRMYKVEEVEIVLDKVEAHTQRVRQVMQEAKEEMAYLRQGIPKVTVGLQGSDDMNRRAEDGNEEIKGRNARFK
jgi:methyl-accepting chemotaxis protein